MENQITPPAKFSIPSIIAIASAVASFASGAFFGFVLAMIAVVFGAIGVILAFSSRVRGGIVSTLALLGGLLGFIAAVVKTIRWLL
jgi:hypothetical protein